MLGIRRYMGCAIDLFTGERALFASDRDVDGGGLLGGLATAEAAGVRHVAVHGAVNPEAAFGELKAFLTTRGHGGNVQRVTIVVPTVESYYQFQDVLFASFPEEASANR